ncbi:MAG TPA: hypothetical protein VJN18_14970 [Polyangiaceae bacterium]|nr:hypothetical protein [Polyangiaceae bacterium]
MSASEHDWLVPYVGAHNFRDGEAPPARVDVDEHAAKVRTLNVTHDVCGGQGEPSISD